MVELEHVHVAHRHFAIERLAGTAVIQQGLTTYRKVGELEHGLDLGFVRTRSEEHTSELQSLMRISYAVFCLKKKNNTTNYKKKTVYIYSTNNATNIRYRYSTYTIITYNII